MKRFINSFFEKNTFLKIIALYAIAFWAIIFLVALIFRKDLLEASNFLYWDAEHYHYISKFRYEDYRVAFFPLLPLIWRWLALDVYGIVIVNSLIFFCSFWLLSRELKLSVKEITIILTIPCFIFFYLPFSESLFFFSSTLIIIGLRNDKWYHVLTGLFIASLSRPAFLIFIPALIIAEYSVRGASSASFAKFKTVATGILILAAGTLVVAIIQYVDTHEWFKFWEAQKGWGNHLQIPKLPLTSWAGGNIVRLDGSAFLVGALSGIFLLLWLLRVKYIEGFRLQKETVFSLAYLGGITLSVLMFRGGSLFSLNRFVYATAFMVVAMHFFLNLKLRLSNKDLLYIFLLMTLVWVVLFHAYSHIQYFMKFVLLSLYLLLPFSILSEKQNIQRIGLIVLVAVNFTFQILLFIRFLSGGWIA